MAGRAVVVPRLCKIDTIEIDSCREETHTLTNTVTDHPVEQGFNASDHSRPDPDIVTLVCFISNTPLSNEQRSRAVEEGSFKFTTSSDQDVGSIGDVEGRGVRQFEALKKLRDDGTLITVATTLKTYGANDTEGMMIQSLTVPRTSKNYDGLEFTALLKQVRIVKNKQVTAIQPKVKKAQPKTKKGEKAPAEDESVLYKTGKFRPNL